MFVYPNKNLYILKCVNSLVLFTEMAYDKNQTNLQVRRVRVWTHLGWLEVPRTHRSFSSGNFQPPSVRPIPDSPSCKYVCYRTKGSGFRTTVNRNIFVPDLCCPLAHAATNPIANHLNFEPCPKTFNRESRHFLSGDIWISDNSVCKRLPQSYCLSFLSICYMYCISRESSLYSNPTAEIIQIFCLLYIQCPRGHVFEDLSSHCYVHIVTLV